MDTDDPAQNEIAQNAWEITDAHQEILFDDSG